MSFNEEWESARSRLLADWSGVRAVDHHCHPLRRWPARLEANEFRACFTEATDARVLTDHVPQTPLYRMLLRRLAPVFGCQPTEAAILTARHMLEPARYARELLERSRTGMMLLDHGFGGPDAMTVEEHRAALPIPQREIVRVEALAEGLVTRHRRPEDWLDSVRAALEQAVHRGAVAGKTIVGHPAALRPPWADHRTRPAQKPAPRRRARGGPNPAVRRPPLPLARVCGGRGVRSTGGAAPGALRPRRHGCRPGRKLTARDQDAAYSSSVCRPQDRPPSLLPVPPGGGVPLLRPPRRIH